MAEYCPDGRFRIRRTVWESQNQYRAVVDKFLGWGGVFDEIEVRAKDIYGCSGVMCDSGSLDYAINLGYSADNIVMSFSDYPYQDLFHNAKSKK